METARVFVVSDDPLVRAGLAGLLESQGLIVAGQGSSEGLTVEALASADIDVVVTDTGAEPDGAVRSGLRGNLMPADAGYTVLALVPDGAEAGGLLAAGVRGVLPLDVDGDVLAAAVSGMTGGLVVLDPAFVGAARARDRETPPLVEDLTPRELEVLQLLAEGLSNKEIARRLDLSEHTVKAHVDAILGKLGAHSRTEAVTRAARLGLIIL
jgi:DNA-binding NarL/FixJ family response regulator